MNSSSAARLPATANLKIVMWIAAAVLVVVGSLVSLQGARAATTLNVTSTVDSANGTLYECPSVTKPCTLRLAIAAANNTTADTIAIPPGTYTLTTHAELEIRSAMTIVGADPRTTIIDGDSVNQADNRIFNILPNPINVGISNLTLQHAFCSCQLAAAIRNQSTGTVRLDNDSILNNRLRTIGPSFGGAIYNGSQGLTHLVITHSLFEGNAVQHGTDTGTLSRGGGIYNSGGGTLAISNTTMTGNSAETGGAIFSTGVTTLVNDTIAANMASLLPNNNKGGGGLVDEAPASIALTNTIVSGNSNGDCRKFFDSGIFTSGGHNIDSDGSCFLTGTGDQPSTNPRLAALALNAPGQTATMAIDTTSPAYNTAGAAACPGTDQRGVTRPQGAACDIGAYELIVVAPAPSPSPTPALPKAGESSGPGQGAGLVLFLIALLLAPVALKMARRRYPDDLRAG